MEKATFGAGCFWQVELAFRRVHGVQNTAVGYAGGTIENPTYQQVCAGGTGHAEVVHVDYDPDEIAYEELLEIFWKIHDPTTRDRQGVDVGAQYRSVIFFCTPEQEASARSSRAKRPNAHAIVTEIVPAAPFYRAEEYHQCYLEKRHTDL